MLRLRSTNPKASYSPGGNPRAANLPMLSVMAPYGTESGPAQKMTRASSSGCAVSASITSPSTMVSGISAPVEKQNSTGISIPLRRRSLIPSVGIVKQYMTLSRHPSSGRRRRSENPVSASYTSIGVTNISLARPFGIRTGSLKRISSAPSKSTTVESGAGRMRTMDGGTSSGRAPGGGISRAQASVMRRAMIAERSFPSAMNATNRARAPGPCPEVPGPARVRLPPAAIGASPRDGCVVLPATSLSPAPAR